MTALRAVGRVVKAHGIRGELMVDVSTDSAEFRFAVGAVLFVTSRDGSVSRTLTVTAARPHSGRLLVYFDGVVGRDAAEELRGAVLSANPDDLPAIDDPDEFYDHQLEGLAAVTVSGDVVGTVREVMHGAGGELLVIDRTDGAETLVPFVRAIVPEVDLAGRRVLLDPPDGLLSDE
ncbi:MAG TPA: ribosome maturation factor RimM [Pseudonocardiaceae bacterium]|jgi:16S rRNA processing protein RimM|nr:ribosome maturation factor RimM [Pseudonocardiaceae bacterium]